MRSRSCVPEVLQLVAEPVHRLQVVYVLMAHVVPAVVRVHASDSVVSLLEQLPDEQAKSVRVRVRVADSSQASL